MRRCLLWTRRQPPCARSSIWIVPEEGALLMGHSYGGPVIARTAMNYSEPGCRTDICRDYWRSQTKWAALV